MHSNHLGGEWVAWRPPPQPDHLYAESMASSKNSARKRSRRTPSDFIQFIALSIVAGFVTAGLIIPPAAAVGLSTTASINWFKGLPDDMEDGPLSQPTVFQASDGTEIARFYAENRTEVGMDKISQNMKDAQLSIEDNNFYHHGGVDGTGILRAIANNFINPNSRQGASTITQQYVNNLLIDKAGETGGDASATIGANKGMTDKIKEMKLAISMEQNKSKDEILNGYLNIVNYGGTSYGVEAAAYHYWGIHAKDLNIQQSATLAGMVQSPVYYNPINNPEASKNRRDTVLYKMHEYGKISDAEYQQAKDSKLDLDVHTTNSGCAAVKEAPYFCDYVRNLITTGSLDVFGDSEEQRLAALTRGGLRIRTTLDLKAQREAQKQVEASQPIEDNPDDVNTALISVQPGTGNILSMAQNSNYSTEDGPQNTEWNYAVDQDMGGLGGFQPGSTFKPFTLAEWIKEGNGVHADIDASSLAYPAGFKWRASCKPGGTVANPGTGGKAWTFQNAEEGFQRPSMPVDYGIYNSINSALYQTASYTDLCGTSKLIKDLHVTSRGKDIRVENGLSLLLGATEVAPMTMANAFATYAAEGKYCAPRAIDSVTNRKGEKLKVPGPQCNQAIDKNVANGVSYVLKNVLTQGSGYKRGIGLPDASAAKTGTNDNSSQTWFVGYTRGIATASWAGSAKANSRSLNGLSINGVTKDYVDGADVAGGQWQAYMQNVVGDYNKKKFTDPSETTQGYGIRSRQASQN